MRLTISLFILISSFVVAAQEVNIIPQPSQIIMGKGFFNINNETKILSSEKTKTLATYLADYLKVNYGLKCKISSELKSKNSIDISFAGSTSDEVYAIEVNNEGILIESGEKGLFYGIQTLIQLLPFPNQNSKNPQLSIPQLSIYDYPRFAYRGLHLDCARHFWSVDFIKKYIDYLALYKFNTFHWHLTDDQGWRIEIKKYPKLTSVGSWRNGTIIGRYPGTDNDGIKYGGFYTQQQIKEIVKYATDRYINVIPEIEMPGHASAAIASYPDLSCFPDKSTAYPKECAWSGPTAGKQVQQTWGVFDDVFCAGKENTFHFLEDVMDEVLALFPSKYIHVGGDESPKAHWKLCPACQQRIKDNKLKDEHELQSYFIQRMEKYLNKKGRTLIGWDEILEGGLAPNAVVMSWRGEQGGIDAAKQNHDVIMTPGNPVYFDHSQSENEDSVTIGGYNPIEKVYAYDPVPKELNDEQAKHILGAQANMWAEYLKNTNKVEYMLFPRIAALSEVLWSPKEKKNWSDFEKRLQFQFKRYDLWKVNYSKAYFDLKERVLPADDNNGVFWRIDNTEKYKELGYYKISQSNKTNKYELYEGPIRILTSGEYIITEIKRSNENCPECKTIITEKRKQAFSINKATGKKITLTNEASKNYPGDGAFTLVNGVINEKGLAKSKEFLGFSGADCEAIIDLGSLQSISFVVVNTLSRPASWIYRPQTAEVLGSGDGKTWYPLKLTDDFQEKKDGTGKGTMTMAFKATYAQYVKIVVKNWGIIPEGNPGAGNKAWLFIDEIEVN